MKTEDMTEVPVGTAEVRRCGCKLGEVPVLGEHSKKRNPRRKGPFIFCLN